MEQRILQLTTELADAQRLIESQQRDIDVLVEQVKSVLNEQKRTKTTKRTDSRSHSSGSVRKHGGVAAIASLCFGIRYELERKPEPFPHDRQRMLALLHPTAPLSTAIRFVSPKLLAPELRCSRSAFNN